MRRVPHPVPSIAVLAALAASCAGEGGDTSGGTPAVDSAGDAVEARPSLPALLGGVHRRTAEGTLPVLDGLPAPGEIRKRPVTNRHEATLTDTLVTYAYPGMQVEVYSVTASGREIVRSIEVSGEGYRTAGGVGPGETRAEVVAVLGEPDRVEASTLVYRLVDSPDDPTPTELAVRFRDGRVERMTWSYYVE